MPLNQTVIYPRDAYPASSYCNWFYLGAQASGDIENDVSGKAVAAKNSTFTDGECWATAGYATVGGATDNYATIASTTADLQSFATHTLIVAVRIKKSAAAFPGVENYVYSSYKPGSEYGGIVLASRVDGSARLYINSADNTTVSLTTATNVITDGGTANERTLVFIVPREGGNGYIGLDGLEVVSATVAAVSGKAMAGGRTARLGVSLAGVAADAHGVASFQSYCVPLAGSSIQRLAVYDWVQRNPHLPIPDWVFGL